MSTITPAFLKALRQRLGWSQYAMADYLRVNQSQVTRYESGEYPIRGPVKRLIEQLAAEHPVPGKTKRRAQPSLSLG